LCWKDISFDFNNSHFFFSVRLMYIIESTGVSRLITTWYHNQLIGCILDALKQNNFLYSVFLSFNREFS
jgi:hypothetical protein